LQGLICGLKQLIVFLSCVIMQNGVLLYFHPKFCYNHEELPSLVFPS
jgi:hypothetical protein